MISLTAAINNQHKKNILHSLYIQQYGRDEGQQYNYYISDLTLYIRLSIEIYINVLKYHEQWFSFNKKYY